MTKNSILHNLDDQNRITTKKYNSEDRNRIITKK